MKDKPIPSAVALIVAVVSADVIPAVENHLDM
jgi:hypothetical protein